jgi:hypothetical protein
MLDDQVRQLTVTGKLRKEPTVPVSPDPVDALRRDRDEAFGRPADGSLPSPLAIVGTAQARGRSVHLLDEGTRYDPQFTTPSASRILD